MNESRCALHYTIESTFDAHIGYCSQFDPASTILLLEQRFDPSGLVGISYRSTNAITQLQKLIYAMRPDAKPRQYLECYV